MLLKIKSSTVLIFSIILLSACTSKAKFKVGECVLPPDGGADKVLKILSIQMNEYRVVSHSLSAGKVIQSKTEVLKTKTELENGYFVVDCPNTENE